MHRKRLTLEPKVPTESALAAHCHISCKTAANISRLDSGASTGDERENQLETCAPNFNEV